MLIHHLILTYTRALQVALKFVAIKIKLANPNQLRIVAYHDIPPEKEGAFFDQLKFYRKVGILFHLIYLKKWLQEKPQSRVGIYYLHSMMDFIVITSLLKNI